MDNKERQSWHDEGHHSQGAAKLLRKQWMVTPNWQKSGLGFPAIDRTDSESLSTEQLRNC